MLIQKMPWAGIRVTTDGGSVAIDPLFQLPSKFGQPQEPLYPFDEFGAVDAVLITHLHADHFDPQSIIRFYGADVPVYVPEATAEAARQSGLLQVTGAAVGSAFAVGGLNVTAAPSADGLGDPQIAWIVEDDGRKLIHCGDTLWHGSWWAIAAAHGPFAAACLPVNGAVIELPGLTPSGQPICLTPEQAAAAARVLQAAALIPIHYGLIHNPPHYVQTPELLARLQASVDDTINLTILRTHETVVL